MLLRMNSVPFLLIGLLTMSVWCVELCLEGSTSLLYFLCSSVSVCSRSLLQHSRFSSKMKSVIAASKWYATKWSRILWLLSESSVLFSCSPPPVSLKGKPICSEVSHDHVDSSSNSALKATNSFHCYNYVWRASYVCGKWSHTIVCCDSYMYGTRILYMCVVWFIRMCTDMYSNFVINWSGSAGTSTPLNSILHPETKTPNTET